MGGCLLVHLLGGFSPDTYGADQSFIVFTAAVVGGLGSLLGAGTRFAVPEGLAVVVARPEWQTLASAVGVLLVLMIIPGGIGDV